MSLCIKFASITLRICNRFDFNFSSVPLLRLIINGLSLWMTVVKKRQHFNIHLSNSRRRVPTFREMSSKILSLTPTSRTFNYNKLPYTCIGRLIASEKLFQIFFFGCETTNADRYRFNDLEVRRLQRLGEIVSYILGHLKGLDFENRSRLHVSRIENILTCVYIGLGVLFWG